MARSVDNAFRWTPLVGLQPLVLPAGGVSSRALGVSGDGTITVGYYVDGSNQKHACMWIGNSVIPLNELSSTVESEARAISTDGTTVVGRCVKPALTPVYWTVSAGVPGTAQTLGFLNGGTSGDAYGVSGNGAVIVGQATDGGNSGVQTAVKWPKGTGVAANVSAGVNSWSNLTTYAAGDYVTASDNKVYQSLISSNLGHDPVATVGTDWAVSSLNSSIAYCANSNGSVIAGQFHDNDNRAFTNVSGVATTRAGMDALLNVSADGLHFAAVSKTGLQAGAWTAAGGVVNLPGAPGSGSDFSPGISSDGTRIVGQDVGATGTYALQACYWTTPFASPAVVLMGVMQGGSYSYAEAASTNGLVIVGYGDFDLTNTGGFPGLPDPSPFDPPAFDVLQMVTGAIGSPYWVERSTKGFGITNTLTDAWFLDSAVEPTLLMDQGINVGVKLYGLWHLRNASGISVFINGLDCGGTYTVAADGTLIVPYLSDPDQLFTQASFLTATPGGSGVSTLGGGNPNAVVGYSYASQGQVLRPAFPQDAGAANGPALGKTRRVHMYSLLAVNCVGVSVGPSFAKLRSVQFKTPGGTLYKRNQMFNGVHEDTVDDDYDFDGMLSWQVTRPYPVTISTIGGFIHTQDR